MRDIPNQSNAKSLRSIEASATLRTPRLYFPMDDWKTVLEYSRIKARSHDQLTRSLELK